MIASDVEFTEEFREWRNTLIEDQQDDVAQSVGLLAELGACARISLQFEDQRIASQWNAGVANPERWDPSAHSHFVNRGKQGRR